MKKTTVRASLLRILTNKSLPSFLVQKELVRRGHKPTSDSATTARIRDLRKIGKLVLCEKNGKYWEYSVVEER